MRIVSMKWGRESGHVENRKLSLCVCWWTCGYMDMEVRAHSLMCRSSGAVPWFSETGSLTGLECLEYARLPGQSSLGSLPVSVCPELEFQEYINTFGFVDWAHKVIIVAHFVKLVFFIIQMLISVFQRQSWVPHCYSYATSYFVNNPFLNFWLVH